MTEEGMTFEEIGAGMFALMQTETRVSLACPFGNGLASFIGRNNDHYAKEFCSRGCSPCCYFEMITENKKRYERNLRKIEDDNMPIL